MTETLEDVTLRVNGCIYERIEVRLRIVDGYPCGPREVAVHDALLGQVILSSEDIIEIKPGEGAWLPVRLPALIGFLEGKITTPAS